MIIESVKRAIQSNLNITQGTTPVIYFGDYDRSKACTVSLNPSDREFIDKRNGKMLSGVKERLCSRIKLGKKDNEPLTDYEANIVLKYCKDYFKNNPLDWFNKFEYLINKFGYSYYNDSCVNLDLIQWATTPFWDELDDNIKSIHLEEDMPVLEYLLNRKKQFEVIFINGSTVKNICSKYFSNIMINEKETEFKNNNGKIIKFHVYTGNYNGIKIIGWSKYLQSPAIGGYKNIDILYNTIIKEI